MKYQDLPNCCFLVDKTGYGVWYVWRAGDGKLLHHNVMINSDGGKYCGNTVPLDGTSEVTQHVIEMLPILKKVTKK